MKRDKLWWSRLTKYERGYLVYLERMDAKIGGHSAALPDDCHSCPACGTPSMGIGLCRTCSRELDELIAKGNGDVNTAEG